LTVARVPAGAVVSSLSVSAQRGTSSYWDADLVLTSHGSSVDITVGGQPSCTCVYYVSSNATVHGARAWLIPNRSITICYGTSDWGRVEVSWPGHSQAESDRNAPAALAPLGLQGLADAVTVLADPTGWRPELTR
jgi:hypothetical protein